MSEGTENQDSQNIPQQQPIIRENGENNEENANAVSEEALKDISRYLEGRAQTLLKNAYELLNIYFLFLGALLTAVAQVSSSSSSKCHQRIYFIPLSVIPFLLNGIPLLAMAGEYVKVKNEYDKCALERENRRDGRNGHGLQPQPDAYRETVHKFGLGIAIVVLVVFNGVVVFACNDMLCGDDKDVSADAGGCGRVCNKICATG